MEKTFPKIEYNIFNPLSDIYLAIEVNGEIVHFIDDLDTFYELFGYTGETRKLGVSPDEFIRSEYTIDKKFDFGACIQIQIIEYLRIRSPEFMKKFGNICNEWLTTLETLRAHNYAACSTCKAKPFCSS
jgi:hypothetical protein